MPRRVSPIVLAGILLGFSCCAGEAEDGPAAFAEVASGAVRLLVPPAERSRPESARLAAALDRAAAGMAARLGAPALQTPLRVVVEPDHVAQARHTGEVGEAVLGEDGALHLVRHPDDLPAYRFALARMLLARSGFDRLPPWLGRGAALWLSRDWYGRPYPEWLPALAAARVLPSPERLLSPAGEGDPGDGSTLLWTPAAAAVVERLPGVTLAEKLREAPARERVAAILRDLAGKDRPAPAPERVRAAPRLPFLKGVSLAMLNRVEEGYHAPSVDRQLAVLQRLGANAVSLMPFAFQPAADRPELRYLNRRPGSETDAGLVFAARRARARGFRVLWKPHLWIGHTWTGEVAMQSDADWALWWQGYRRYVLHHALLARWAGADLFSVGVELSKTLGREREWRELIADVRRFFPGAVTYSANWYGDLEGVPFWDDLDVVGVDAYFPLAASPQAKRADLEAGARAVVRRLEAASRRHHKPVLLTEVGFPAERAAWVEPHTEGGEYSEEDQALAYDVLLHALGRPRWLAGTFLWKAFSGDGGDSGHRADFRFLGRRAEAVVRSWYSR